MTKIVSHWSQVWGNCLEGDGRLDGLMGMPCNQLGECEPVYRLKINNIFERPPNYIYPKCCKWIRFKP